MSITNKNLHLSEKRRTFQWVAEPSLGIGETFPLIPAILIPYKCQMQAISTAAIGISGTPNLSFTVGRFIPGVGSTQLVMGDPALNSVILQEYGASGSIGFSGLANGVSYPITQLLTNDLVFINFNGSGVAALRLAVCFCVEATEDIVHALDLQA